MSPTPWSLDAFLSLKDEHMEVFGTPINWIFNAKETETGANLIQDKYSHFTALEEYCWVFYWEEFQ